MTASLRDLFDRARSLGESERQALLAGVEAGNPELGARLRRMLDAAHGETSPLDVAPWEALASEPPSEPPERIGPYRLIRAIGRGGMGAVYLAEEERPDFRRTVALKLIDRPGFDAAATRRFRDEIRILSALEHPGIARFLDGGRAPDGTLFLALEYVEGEAAGERQAVYK